MPLGPAILGVVISILFFFIALVLYDAIGTNVADCSSFDHSASFDNTTQNDTGAFDSCNAMKRYAGIVFTIAPIAILLDVFGVIPVFGGKFSFR
jgi:hypothetical protein